MAMWITRSRNIAYHLKTKIRFMEILNQRCLSSSSYSNPLSAANYTTGKTCRTSTSPPFLSHGSAAQFVIRRIKSVNAAKQVVDRQDQNQALDFLGGNVAFTSDLSFISEVPEKKVHCYRVLDDDGYPITSNNFPQVSKELAVKMYSDMVALQTMDTIFYEAQRQGRICFYATATGEEAVNIAPAAALTLDDIILPQYREPGVLLWRGFTMQEFADQLFTNKADYGKGRQMHIHYGSNKLNCFTMSAPIATQLPQAVGVAYSLKMENNNACAVTFCGDGGTSEGDFHAALNFAAVMEAPVVFICRNNGWAISTPSSEQFRTGKETLIKSGDPENQGIHWANLDSLTAPKGQRERWLLQEEIKAFKIIPIGMRERDDVLVWHFSNSGQYAVKSGYSLARKLSGGTQLVIMDNTVSGWRPAPLGKLKINCDASFCNQHSSASIAAVMRDSHGHLVDGIARAIDASSVVSAEAKAVRIACVVAHSYSLSYVEIESDSQMAINLCVSETVPPWESSAVLLDIREFAAQHHLSFSWTSRHNNMAAHWVAKALTARSLPSNWCDGIAVKGQAYGIRSTQVDGNDALAVYEAVREARHMAITEQRPILIEALTYRVGHHSTSDDSTKYRPVDEIEYWRNAKSPVTRFRKWVERNGWWSETDESELRTKVRHQVMQAIQVAERTEKPSLTEMFTDVYDTLPSNLLEQEMSIREAIKRHPQDYPLDVPV
ncbi:unnamed protein product [Camellia sinensis]